MNNTHKKLKNEEVLNYITHKQTKKQKYYKYSIKETRKRFYHTTTTFDKNPANYSGLILLCSLQSSNYYLYEDANDKGKCCRRN